MFEFELPSPDLIGYVSETMFVSVPEESNRSTYIVIVSNFVEVLRGICRENEKNEQMDEGMGSTVNRSRFVIWEVWILAGWHLSRRKLIVGD